MSLRMPNDVRIAGKKTNSLIEAQEIRCRRIRRVKFRCKCKAKNRKHAVALNIETLYFAQAQKSECPRFLTGRTPRNTGANLPARFPKPPKPL